MNVRPPAATLAVAESGRTMKVAFDDRAAVDTRGVGRYVRCLLEALHQSGRGEIVETRDPRRFDLFHTPTIDGALLRSPVPMVVTIHDLVPLKRRGEYLRSGLRFKLRYLAAQRAVRVIVPTAAVAVDVTSILEIPADRIRVIPEAAAAVFRPRSAEQVAAVRERYSLPERYLLWVGGLRAPDPRKRIGSLARIKRTLPLVLVGTIGRWAREIENVTLTGRVTDDELAAIYTGAHALVFPSDDEGFGLPPVEALACGTPVVASDIPPLREVLAGRADLAPVDDLDALIALAENAQRPAPEPPPWTWADAATATWDVYAEAATAPERWRGARRRRSTAGVQAHQNL
jgi:glycosyltransferase involved in cell wall biosynthesis